MRAFFICLLIIGSNLFALNNEAKIDLIKIKLVEQQKKGQYKEILNSINEWRSIDSNLPISLVYWEGKAFYNVKNYIGSYKSLEKYINGIGREGRFYQDALKLFLKVEPLYKKELVLEEKRKASKDRVVSFENTGLMWQDDFDVISKKMTSYTAVNYCKNLKLAGFDDWRVPTASEFMTIMEHNKKPAINSSFKNIEYSPKYYPYQHIYERNSKKTYYIGNYDGKINYSSSSSYKVYVRCVRDDK